jgi:predicted hydrocarbon binding protein
MQFQPFEQGIEVNGRTVHSVVDGLGAFQNLAKRYLVPEGIGTEASGKLELDLDGWYPHDAWLRAFARIAKDIGEETLFQIGRSIPKNAAFPPSVVDIHSAMQAIDVAYHLNHRKNRAVMFDVATGAMQEGIGHYRYEAVKDPPSILVVCHNPYPCAFDRGIITAMGQKFELTSRVSHEDEATCRAKGGSTCTYRVTW